MTVHMSFASIPNPFSFAYNLFLACCFAVYYRYTSVVILLHIVAKNYECVLLFVFSLSLQPLGKFKRLLTANGSYDTPPPCMDI